ncbi:MAG TPA: guanylate kinase [Symbiobacteriaceae bacterium]|nr:guanylate kinase [Symbiobacteriaceae bacterium]
MPLKVKGLLIVVTGPSAVGKGTICDALRRTTPNVHFSVSCTTRQARPGEVHGREYYFISHEEFQRKIGQGELLEWAQVYENWYGTPREHVDRMIDAGHDVILDIDMQGARRVREMYPGSVFVFVIPPSMEALRQRIVGRGTENDESVRIRLEQAPKWIEEGLQYDYVIVNDDLQTAVGHLHCIIGAEKSRTTRRGGALIRQLLEKGELE